MGGVVPPAVQNTELKMFSKVKGLLRTAAARAKDALVDALADALRRVRP